MSYDLYLVPPEAGTTADAVYAWVEGADEEAGSPVTERTRRLAAALVAADRRYASHEVEDCIQVMADDGIEVKLYASYADITFP